MLTRRSRRYARSIAPDYTLSVRQVLEATALASVTQTQNLEFLSHVFGPRLPNLPSFIPDWTTPNHNTAIQDERIRFIDMSRKYDTSGGRTANVKVSDGTLSTAGLLFDLVADNGSMSRLRTRQNLDELHAIAHAGYDLNELYCHTADTRAIAFQHVLCGSITVNPGGALADMSRRLTDPIDWTPQERWRAWYLAPSPFRDDLFSVEVSYTDQLLSSLQAHRKFIRTAKGYIGKCAITPSGSFEDHNGPR